MSDSVDRLRMVSDLVEVAGQLPPTSAVLAGGDRVEDLRLVESARDHGMIDRIVLVGCASRIHEAMAEVGIEVPPTDILHADSGEEAAARAVEIVRSGAMGMMLKGSVSTPLLHRHMLPLANRSTISLVTLFDAAPVAGGRPMILTDAGVTTVCSLERVTGLVRNAIDVARMVLGIGRPKVAILSANEKPIASLPSSQLGIDIANLDWPEADVYGPLSFDIATDERAAAIKGIPDRPGARGVAGQADVLVCPGIDSANVIYKMLNAMVKYGMASMANIIVGFPVSYVLLSRADALDTRLNSLALGNICAQRGLGKTV
ncbi:MAG: putative butyrate kinase [Candidatus Hydrogenedentes bacterium]|nr:putative butyrate kinase [Candidatus Hydrogenedentota bacterium]